MAPRSTNLFHHFTVAAERIGATSSRLEKAAVLAEYFPTLADDDLMLAARYFAGVIFPLRDNRTANVGGAALLKAVQEASGADDERLRARLVELGDFGDVTGEAFQSAPELQARLPMLALPDINAAFETLAATSGTKKKIVLVVELLSKAAPLEAKYLIKLLAGDLRIGLKEGAVEDAIARLHGHKVGRVQWVNMLTGDIGETALLARHDRLDQAHMRLFHPLKFMLATAATGAEEVARQMPGEVIVEDKFDGIRAQAHIGPHVEGDEVLHGVTRGDRRVALFSRTLDEITLSFPDLVAPLAAVLREAINPDSGLILDGEIVPVRGERILPFQELQKRLGRKEVAEAIRTGIPVAFIAYDALYAGEKVLLNEPLEARRQLLDTLPVDGQSVRVAVSQRWTALDRLDDEFDAARARGNEGLMVKVPSSLYKPGRRGRDWLKIKKALATLDVVVTAVEVGSGRRSKFLSDYTFAVRRSESDGTLLNVGKAYSGLTDAEIGELSEWFRAHTLQQFAHGKVRVVEPKIVIEVTFDRVQPSARHKSGYALRFPRILRVREDKPLEEIDTLEAVRRLAETTGQETTTQPAAGAAEHRGNSATGP